MSIFDFSGKSGLIPTPSWAKKIGRNISGMFDVEDGSQPVVSVKAGDKESLTPGVSADFTQNTPSSWKVYKDRKSIYNDIERMDANDEIISTALDIVADCAVGFTDLDQQSNDPKPLFFSKQEKVMDILNTMDERIGLTPDLWQLVREFYPHGTIFREVIIDRSEMRVKAFNQTVSYQIFPNTNDKGHKQPGWIVRQDKDLYNDGGVMLDEWQIVPFQYGVKRGYLTVPPLASARAGWKRLYAMEDGMAVARLVRAYDKYVHRVPIKENYSKGEILNTLRTYREHITKKRMMTSDGHQTENESTLDVQSDFFIPDDGKNKGGVEVLASNNIQLGNLNDIYYAREKLLARLKVPVAYLQIQSSMKTHMSKGSNSDTVDIQFARTLRSVQAALRRGIQRLSDLELMLHGIIPTKGLYTINLPEINVKDLMEDAKVELTYGQAAAFFVEAFGALPPSLIAAKFFKLNDKQQTIMDTFLAANGDKIMEARIKAIENTAIPPPGMPGGPPAKAMPGGTGGVGASSGAKSTGTGSGGHNKSKASNSKSQQSVEDDGEPMVAVSDLVDIFYTLNKGVFEDLEAQGIPVPELGESHRQHLRRALADMAYTDGNIAV